MSGNKTISMSETRLEALQLQSSAYGVAVPVVWGVTRIPGNLIWYGGFRAIPSTSTESQGGKGGGVKTQRTTYRYEAAVLMGLCQGPVSGVRKIWKGKNEYAGGPTSAEYADVTESFPSGPNVSYTVVNAAQAVGLWWVQLTASGSTRTLARDVDYSVPEGQATVVLASHIESGGTAVVRYQFRTNGLQSSLQALNLSFQPGHEAQAPLAWQSSLFPAEALGYSGLVYVGSQAYDLGTAAQVENHGFEIVGRGAYMTNTLPDVSAAFVAHEVLTDGRWGAQFPSARLQSVFLSAGWHEYCVASGLLMSPALTEQQRAADVLEKLARLTNCGIVWSGNRLKIIPYADLPVTGNGVTFTPNTTPIYDLTDDHFVVDGAEDPLEVEMRPASDRYNVVRLEWSNREKAYQVEVTEAKDQADIETNGPRVMPTIEARWICEIGVARTVAQLIMQRSLLVQRTYRFRLPWSFALLEPMDLVTLTDPVLGMNRVAVRITEIEESEFGDLSVVAEDFPLGSASATLYPSQTGQGFQANYNVPPGNAAPVIFELPGQLTTNGLEIGVASSGIDANWGGAQVWVSLDGTNYRQIGELNGASRYGGLAGAITAGSTSLSVFTTQGPGSALTSGTAADAQALNTLCMLRNAAGTVTEFFAYQTATLVGPGEQTLAGLVRGAYDTVASAFASGSTFVRIDESIARSGLIDLAYVGRTISVKLCSFNVYGGALQTLADVPAYTYTITGARIYGNAGADALRDIDAASSDNVLSRIEKPQIILDWQRAQADHAGLESLSLSRGVGTERAAYINAYNALSTYLGTLTTPAAWNSLAGDTTIVGTTFRSTWASFYATRQALLNRIEITSPQDENLCTNGRGASTDGWSINGAGSISATPSGVTFWPAAYGSSSCLNCSARDHYFGSPIPVRPGDAFFLSWDSMPFGGGVMNFSTRLGFAWVNAAGAIVAFTTGTDAAIRPAALGGAQRITNTCIVPATPGGQPAAFALPWIQVDKPSTNSSGAAGDGIHATNIIVRRLIGTQRIQAEAATVVATATSSQNISGTGAVNTIANWGLYESLIYTPILSYPYTADEACQVRVTCAGYIEVGLSGGSTRVWFRASIQDSGEWNAVAYQDTRYPTSAGTDHSVAFNLSRTFAMSAGQTRTFRLYVARDSTNDTYTVRVPVYMQIEVIKR